VFAKTKSARKWLAKYNDKELEALPRDLRRKINYFKAAQAFTIVAIVVGLFSYTVWMMALGVLGVAMLLFMRKAFEPALDRAIEKHKRTADVLAGTGDMAGATPLERAKATYLALPEGDPRVELALKEYKAELAKAQAGPAEIVAGAEADPVAEMEAAKTKYLAMAEDDPMAESALQDYLAAMKRAKAAGTATAAASTPPAEPAPQPVQATPPPAPKPPEKPEIDPETAMKIAEAKYLALKDGDPQMARVMQEYLKAKARFEAVREDKIP
jgi:hypothetical protein